MKAPCSTVSNLLRPLISVFKLFLVCLLLVPIFLITFLYRTAVWGLAKSFRPDLESFVTGVSAIFTINGAGKPTLNIISVMLVKGPIQLNTLREHVQDRIVNAKDPMTGELLYIRLRKTWQAFLGYHFWQTDPNFAITNHVKEHDFGRKSTIKCQELYADLGGIYEAPWNEDQSHWELLLFKDVIDDEGFPCSVVILKKDHTLADGYSILEFLRILNQSNFSVPNASLSTRGLTLLEKLTSAGRVPWDLGKALSDGINNNSRHLNWTPSLKNEPMVTLLSPVIPVDKIKRLKTHFGVSYLAVVHAAVLGAINRARGDTGDVTPERLSLAFALPKTGHPHKGLVNHLSLAARYFTYKGHDPAERLKSVNKELLSYQKSSVGLINPFLIKLLSFLPTCLAGLGFGSLIFKSSAVVVTNFPVTNSKEFHHGHEIRSMIAGVGAWGPLGIIFTLFGINNKQICHITVNPSVFADPTQAKNLGVYLMEEIEALEREIDGMEKLQIV